ncbi:MAG: zf-HC2 domain-containing protein [Treponema sp.]|jgi:anti-sigma factor RsiW|nr:zf-HC2 domain-containing protein [Treponema sp.]
MCPDRQILSLYLDGELPSPWKEKMEAHLDSCPACRDRIESWKRISGELRVDVDPLRAERVWERIGGRIAAAEALPVPVPVPEKTVREAPLISGAGRRLPALWYRRVSLPFPAAAALGATAAALVLFFGSFWFRSFTGGGPVPVSASPAIALEAAGIDMELSDIRPAGDVSGLFQYLGDTDSNDTVYIRLPESRSFQRAGEPTIIRAADYTPRRFQK